MVSSITVSRDPVEPILHAEWAQILLQAVKWSKMCKAEKKTRELSSDIQTSIDFSPGNFWMISKSAPPKPLAFIPVKFSGGDVRRVSQGLRTDLLCSNVQCCWMSVRRCSLGAGLRKGCWRCLVGLEVWQWTPAVKPPRAGDSLSHLRSSSVLTRPLLFLFHSFFLSLVLPLGVEICVQP